MAYPQSQSADYDALLSTTLRNYRKKLEDNIFNDMPLMWWLMQKGRKKVEDGGYEIVVPLMYGKNTTAKAYGGYDLLDTTPQEGISTAVYQWKQMAVSIAISRIEERKNSGAHKIINLLEAKIQQAQLSLEDKITEFLLAYPDNDAHASSPYGDTDTEISSLWHFIRFDNDATVNVGGIAQGTYSWWRNYSSWEDTSDASIDWDSTTIGSGLFWWMSHCYNEASKGSDHPDLVLGGMEAYEAYEGLCQPDLRYTNTKVADAGFQNLRYKGATFIFDKAIPGTLSGANAIIAFINSKYLNWVVDKETDFYTTPFMRPENQDAKVAQILLYGQLTCSNRSRQAILELGAGS